MIGYLFLLKPPSSTMDEVIQTLYGLNHIEYRDLLLETIFEGALYILLLVPEYSFHMGFKLVSTNVGWACGKLEKK